MTNTAPSTPETPGYCDTFCARIATERHARHMPSMAINVILHSVYMSHDSSTWCGGVSCCRPAVLLVVIILPYCRIRFNLIHSSLCSGELRNHNCGRSAIGAERAFIIPSYNTMEGLVSSRGGTSPYSSLSSVLYRGGDGSVPSPVVKWPRYGIYSLISLFRIAASSTPLSWSFGMNFVITR